MKRVNGLKRNGFSIAIRALLKRVLFPASSALLLLIFGWAIYQGTALIRGVQAESINSPPPAGAATASAPIPPAVKERLGTINAADWELFKSRFIQPDGKLIDSHSHVAHSEGQGYAMLFAIAANDRESFDKVWNWTRNNLRHDDDALLAWKWKPDDKGGGAIADANDAADGDLLAAWALHRAAQHWHEPTYDETATAIANDILKKLVHPIGGRTFLLPGVAGFERDDGITVNLSYWIFPAFRSLNELVPSKRWAELEESGGWLITKARFASQKLPADWMDLWTHDDGSYDLSLPKKMPPVFGFDGVRVPLYLLWDNKVSPDYMSPFLTFWNGTPPAKIPATVNLATGEVSKYDLLPGMQAVVMAVEGRAAGHNGVTFVPVLPAFDQDQDYYSCALGLLVRLALAET